MTAMLNVSSDTLFSFTFGVLRAIGSPDENARVVADHLVGANLAGHDSHGALRLFQYREHVLDGTLDPAALPRIVRETTTTAVLDGNLAWGQVVAKIAMDLAIERAKEHGLAAVVVRNCYHVGRVGVYPLMAARSGLIAQVFCNAHGIVRVAPWGGTDPKLATNPISIAVPTRTDPVLLDITTSVVAEGKVRLAKLSGKPIPDDWILDRDGNPTTNPEDLYSGGTLLPFGGRQAHKGYGLGVIVELLGGVLSGAGVGAMAEKIGNGLFIQVVDPAALSDRDVFLDRAEAFRAYIKESKPKPGVEEVFLPGEPEQRTEATRRRDGVPIAQPTLEKLNALADELGIDRIET